MAINKIIFGDKAIDLTEDTIRADRLYSGYTAHLRTGEKIVGTLTSAPLEDALLYYDYNIGYISNGQWIYEKPTNTYSDICFANPKSKLIYNKRLQIFIFHIYL
jgi:hypothetical protein